MSEQRSRTWLWVLLGCGAFFVLLIAMLTLVGLAAGKRNSDFAAFGDKIGVVDLEGVIIEPQTMVHDLKDFADDDSIKAIIIHINTPGGGAAASQEIYSEVKRI